MLQRFARLWNIASVLHLKASWDGSGGCRHAGCEKEVWEESEHSEERMSEAQECVLAAEEQQISNPAEILSLGESTSFKYNNFISF